MVIALKRFSFLASIATLTVLNACATISLSDKSGEFYINNIPSSAELHRINYDLTFSLGFTNRIQTKKKNEVNFVAFYGTGWLIDWKEGNQYQPFRVYLATNVHVAAGLKNEADYLPYSQPDAELGWTVDFRLGKYTNVKDFVSPNEIGLPNGAQAFVSAQTSTIPKTAFTAHDFVDYTLPQEQKGKEQKEQQWMKNSQTKDTDVHPYADFAVLEILLFPDSSTDRKIFNHFIQPAIRAYKQLGDSLNIFANQTLDQPKHNRYYLLGYPFLRERGQSLFVSQTGEEKEILGQKAQVPNEDPIVSLRVPSKPTLSRNKGDDFNGSSWAWNYDHTKNFAFNRKFLGKDYQIYGKGIGINRSDLGGGASGSLVLNDKKQIAGIYFGASSSGPNEWGLAQLLRWRTRSGLNEEAISVVYDLIFGNPNTRKYYAQFAKKNNTHLYKQIVKSRSAEFRFVENSNN
ncbi:DUF31 family protein [Mycoplasmoides pneumoniae]|uniref:DUF31 family protein n=1 Tax=Mycoplasmoides pneumoniae TaxID=2104 RepID=UPI0006A6B259|nr:DUF31 family protein [Mycoplasmoides pneumoniae]ALA31854.1 hypothetical protein F536_03325 [Mycoplasmoides pneumoniae 39443]